MANKSPAQLDQEIEDYLAAVEGVHATNQPARAGKRGPRRSASPSTVEDTRVEVRTSDDFTFTFILRPARVHTIYDSLGHGTLMAELAKRSAEAWFVMSKSGNYLGVLMGGSGDGTWAVARLAAATAVIGANGVRVIGLLRTAATWREAVARGWWAT